MSGSRKSRSPTQPSKLAGTWRLFARAFRLTCAMIWDAVLPWPRSVSIFNRRRLCCRLSLDKYASPPWSSQPTKIPSNPPTIAPATITPSATWGHADFWRGGSACSKQKPGICSRPIPARVPLTDAHMAPLTAPNNMVLRKECSVWLHRTVPCSFQS
jgi:hypothetical protein